MSKFQMVLLGIFAVFIVAAVAIFSFSRGGGSRNATITVWGDISFYDFSAALSGSGLDQNDGLQIKYVEKNPDSIETEFTEALATGIGPDLIIISLDQLWKNKNKILEIPYKNISERDFKSTFIEEGELFLAPSGIYALPLLVDPLVLYYNRDLLSNAGIAKPFSFWDEIYTSALKLTIKDGAGNITKSIIALGEARNIPHAKDILTLLLLQAGVPITQFVNGELTPAVVGNFGRTVSPGEAALDFYTQFSNPAKPFYSWNRSLLPANTHFTSGDSAYYLGFASELRTLRTKNPTLNFGVAPVPQSRVSDKALTFGEIKAVAVSRGSKDLVSALTAALKLVSKSFSFELSKSLLLPSARRDILSEGAADDIMSVFYDAALQSEGWIDPDNSASADIFREMIESVTSGRARTSEAISNANDKLESLIK